jgi:twitching motility protein PilT
MAGKATPILELLDIAIEADASDLLLSPGTAPMIRVNGLLKPLPQKTLDDEDTKEYMRLLVSSQHQDQVGEGGNADFAYTLEEKEVRFRGNVCKSREGIVITLRRLPDEIMSFKELELPVATMKGLLGAKKGLILVTGPTGSGKTTTLASMIDYINRTLSVHIITIEAPVEFIHVSKTALVTQRDMPLDTPSFALAVIQALRQDPDVILVGEMRDLETMAAAITAAETGHLVLATLHTNSAAETVDRILDPFPPEQQLQIRSQLASTLSAIISQKLLPRASGNGRIAVSEIMTMTPAIANHIRRSQTHQIPSTIETGKSHGMRTFVDHLAGLVSQGEIAHETALEFASSKEAFLTALRGAT